MNGKIKWTDCSSIITGVHLTFHLGIVQKVVRLSQTFLETYWNIGTPRYISKKGHMIFQAEDFQENLEMFYQYSNIVKLCSKEVREVTFMI